LDSLKVLQHCLQLGWLVDFNKPNFNGRRALLAEKENGSRYALVCLETWLKEASSLNANHIVH